MLQMARLQESAHHRYLQAIKTLAQVQRPRGPAGRAAAPPPPSLPPSHKDARPRAAAPGPLAHTGEHKRPAHQRIVRAVRSPFPSLREDRQGSTMRGMVEDRDTAQD